MRRVGKGFSGVETPLFATMLVQPQPPAAEEEDEVEVPAAPTPPSPTTAPSPPLQEPISPPQQAQPALPSSPPQEQPTDTSESSMSLLTTLMDTCTTLSQKVTRKYQSLMRKPISIAQAMKNMIIYLKNRVGYKMEHFKEMSEKDVKNMLKVVPVSEFMVEALQVKERLSPVRCCYDSAKLQVDEDCEMARYLVIKIFMEANKPKSRSLDTSSK
nr:hypothetical protein [Tanacetum cinerariifolium]